MKSVRKLLTNPFAVAFAVLHWIVLLPALWNSNMHDGNWQLFLAVIIIIIDLPAILPSALLWSPFNLFAEESFAWRGMLLTSFLTITCQWIFIGKFFSNIISPTEPKPTSLSLSDE